MIFACLVLRIAPSLRSEQSLWCPCVCCSFSYNQTNRFYENPVTKQCNHNRDCFYISSLLLCDKLTQGLGVQSPSPCYRAPHQNLLLFSTSQRAVCLSKYKTKRNVTLAQSPEAHFCLPSYPSVSLNQNASCH